MRASRARWRVVLLAGAVVALAGVGACRKTKAPPIKAGTTADSADQVMLNVRTLLVDRGVQRGELLADTAYVFDDNSRFEFRVVKANFNTATGAPNGTLSGKRGRYDIRNGVLEGWGDVVIITTDGRKLTTQQIKFDQARNEVSSDSAFVLSEGDREQRGVGFRSDPNLQRFQVLSGASGKGGTVVLPGQ